MTQSAGVDNREVRRGADMAEDDEFGAMERSEGEREGHGSLVVERQSELLWDGCCCPGRWPFHRFSRVWWPLHLLVSGCRGSRCRCRCPVSCLLGMLCLRLRHANEPRGLVVAAAMCPSCVFLYKCVQV